MNTLRTIGFLVLFTVLTVACQPAQVEPTAVPPTETLPAPTQPAPTQQAPADTATAPAPTATTLPPTLTPVPTDPPPTETLPTATATAEPTVEPVYHVAYVVEDDVLNVRDAPGADNEIVAELRPDQSNIRITGPSREVEGSTWVPIAADGVTGWVNSRFLTAELAPDDFCDVEVTRELVADLRTAVAAQDGELFAQLVHPERGLRVRHNWWNPEVIIPGSDIDGIFSDTTSYEWGVEDGSGFEIVGSFEDEILPLLERDLTADNVEIGCNEILHGGTAGMVILPEGYDAVNHYSIYRPAGPDQVEMDWGTWVVGIEWWDGRYWISYLVHYQWEI